MKKEKPSTKLCKYCKTEIPYDAKVCPQCRKKQKGNGCLIAIVVVVALALLGSCVGGSKDSDTERGSSQTTTKALTEETTQAIEYTAYTVDEMVDDLDKNAMNASDKYKGQYIKITGKLNVIDSNGKYISLTPDKDFAIMGVQCYIKNEDQKNKVKEMTIGDTVTLKGKCKDVGEVLGFSLDIDSID